LILVNKIFTQKRININSHIDFTTIQVRIGEKIIRISSVYKSHGATLEYNDQNILTNHNGSFLIAGDLKKKGDLLLRVL